jgi:hypothetical protein
VKFFNLILKHGWLPKKWLNGKIIYFPKSNRKITKASDYRPITLINNWCKIGETLIIRRIDQHLNERGFFSDLQFGFVKHRSTIDAIRHLINRIKINKIKYKYNVLLLFDFSSAFDSIGWNKIVRNVIDSGADDNIVLAVQDLLMNRSVELNDGKFSTMKGCPQGGRASPTLWRIGMNDLLIKLGKLKYTWPVAFADDTSALLSSNNERDLQMYINACIETIDKWCTQAEVQLNLGKTEIMNLSKNKRNPLSVKINDRLVEFTNKVKYLGIVIDDKLLWREHLEHLKNKCLNLASCIRKLLWMNKNNVKLKLKMNLYYNIFLPMMTYGSQVWYKDIANKKTYIYKINIMQRRVINIITNCYRTTSTEK